MEANNNIRVTNALLQRDIKDLKGSIDELKEDLKGEIAGVKKKLDENEKRLRVVEGYAPVIKAVMYVGGALMLSVLTFLWAIFTNQIQIVVP